MSDQVFVELAQCDMPPGQTRMIGVFLDDDPHLKRGSDIVLESDPGIWWSILSVHRCVERADGTTDHSACFGGQS